MVYRWHYRKYSLRYCIGYRVLNKVYIYIYIEDIQGVFYDVLPVVVYNTLNCNNFFKVYKGCIL